MHGEYSTKEHVLYGIIQYLFLGINLFVVALLANEENIDYFTKKKFFLSNPILFLCLCVGLFGILFFFGKKRIKISEIVDAKADAFVSFFSLFLFFLLIYICYNIYFHAGWDPQVLFITARSLASGNPIDQSVIPYFSLYPNNTTLLWFFTQIIKLNSLVGILDTKDGTMAIIAVNCLLSCLTGLITYGTVKRLLNQEWAFFSWIIYVVFIAINPWVVITYSDQITLIFPILIFFLYSIKCKGIAELIKWLLIGLLSFIGFTIKPPIIVVFISIFLIEGWKFFFRLGHEWKRYLSNILMVSFSLLITIFLHKAIINNLGIEIDSNASVGWPHYMMMGLNTTTDGRYSLDDVLYSMSFSNQLERKEGNFKIIRERINNFTVSSFINFLCRKTLENYGDGTFAWSEEGHFYDEVLEIKNEWMSPFLRSYYYKSGGNYLKTSTFQQMIWVGIIVFMLGIGLIKKERFDSNLAVLMLSIIGVTIFVMSFEARARYLYIFSPIFIVLGIVGLREFRSFFQKCWPLICHKRRNPREIAKM